MAVNEFLELLESRRTDNKFFEFLELLESGKKDFDNFDLVGLQLDELDLSGCSFIGANFTDAELSCAIFLGATLPIYLNIPIIKDIHLELYKTINQEGCTLDMRSWHSEYCKTTHCRAGWVVTLTGKEGIGTDAAAAFIYQKSDPTLERIPNWYANEEEAMADIKRLASKSPNYLEYLKEKYPNCPECPTPDKSFCIECEDFNH
jgi:hypothetical protein